MRGASVRIRRPAVATWFVLLLTAALPAAAHADPTARGYRPNVNNLSVVVSSQASDGTAPPTDLVYITWTDPQGVQPAKVFAVRGDAGACPASPTDGTLIGTTSATNHMIDPNVKAGVSYCYSVFVTDSAGTLVKIGTTGRVPVPDLDAPPPAAAPTSTPAAQAVASGSSGLDETQVKAIVGSAGALMALALLVVIVRVLRRSRAAEARPVWGTELRMTFTGLSASALIIPAVIALAWVLVVTAVVLFR